MNSLSYFQNILFCTDFSENADQAFDFAVDSAKRRPGSTLYLLHVVPEPDAQFWKSYLYEVDDVDNKAKKDIDERIEKNYLSRLPEGVDLKIEFKVGKDYTEILAFAEEHDIDLIVMGREGHTNPLRRAFFGNVVEKVTAKADCAVLVVPLSFCKRKKEG